MEELLNKLIKRGWKPFGITCTNFIKGTGLEGIPSYCFNPHPHIGFAGGTRKYHRPSLRQIVSKDSGLWQFVCENRMVKKSIISRDYFDTLGGCRITFRHENMAFWLIECALKDESELEDFLLQNIKIDGE